ncbi:MAG: type II toxin-antitoxin system VapC family toxin [Ginsengibacter sp.]
MDLLLDTHAFIWFMDGDDSMPERSINAIKDIRNGCFVSAASLWEIAIKLSLKKIELKSGFNKINNFISDNEIGILSITFIHLQKLLTLPFYHRDPFDRIIISQGLSENFTIVTKDKEFENYTTAILWR